MIKSPATITRAALTIGTAAVSMPLPQEVGGTGDRPVGIDKRKADAECDDEEQPEADAVERDRDEQKRERSRLTPRAGVIVVTLNGVVHPGHANGGMIA